jgi:hypothetical protein
MHYAFLSRDGIGSSLCRNPLLRLVTSTPERSLLLLLAITLRGSKLSGVLPLGMHPEQALSLTTKGVLADFIFTSFSSN